MVDIDGVYAKSSAYAVKIVPGFDQLKDNEYPGGTFESGKSSIRNIHSVYGEEAQVQIWKDEKYLPCGLRDRISDEMNPDGRSHQGPAVVPVLYKAYGEGEGHYQVKLSNITTEGYNEQKKEIMIEEDAVENCN